MSSREHEERAARRLVLRYVQQGWLPEARKLVHSHEKSARWWNEFVSAGFADLIALREEIGRRIENQVDYVVSRLVEYSEAVKQTDNSVTEEILKDGRSRIFLLLQRHVLLERIISMRTRNVVDLEERTEADEQAIEEEMEMSSELVPKDGSTLTDFHERMDALSEVIEEAEEGRPLRSTADLYKRMQENLKEGHGMENAGKQRVFRQQVQAVAGEWPGKSGPGINLQGFIELKNRWRADQFGAHPDK